MEKQDEKREKEKRTGKSVAAGYYKPAPITRDPRFCVGGPQNQRNDGETIITKEKYV